MKKSRELDLFSEYYRKCLYCKEPFMANHQLRRFCLQKHDIPNYCKHRYKRLLQESRLAGENIIVDYRQTFPLQAAQTSNGVEVQQTERPIIEESNEQFGDNPVDKPQVLLKNILILQELMQKDKPVTLSPKAISDLGLDLNVFSKKRVLASSGLTFIEIGNYAFFWTLKTEILITPLNEILWM